MPKRQYVNRGASGETEAEYMRDLRLRQLTDERLSHLIERSGRRLAELVTEQARRAAVPCGFDVGDPPDSCRCQLPRGHDGLHRCKHYEPTDPAPIAFDPPLTSAESEAYWAAISDEAKPIDPSS